MRGKGQPVLGETTPLDANTTASSGQPPSFCSTASPAAARRRSICRPSSTRFEQGKGAIVLVPEISLTPQTVERFEARFLGRADRSPSCTAISATASGTTSGTAFTQGSARIVIGARSAVFAPVEELGLIVVDEEHEPTYKQEEAPRYHARDVAVMRGQMEGARSCSAPRRRRSRPSTMPQRQIRALRIAGPGGRPEDAASCASWICARRSAKGKCITSFRGS